MANNTQQSAEFATGVCCPVNAHTTFGSCRFKMANEQCAGGEDMLVCGVNNGQSSSAICCPRLAEATCRPTISSSPIQTTKDPEIRIAMISESCDNNRILLNLHLSSSNVLGTISRCHQFPANGPVHCLLLAILPMLIRLLPQEVDVAVIHNHFAVASIATLC